MSDDDEASEDGQNGEIVAILRKDEYSSCLTKRKFKM